MDDHLQQHYERLLMGLVAIPLFVMFLLLLPFYLLGWLLEKFQT
jgi:hypothetical protein